MLKTRIILVVVCALVIWLIFLLPKAVVENESQLTADQDASTQGKNPGTGHAPVSQDILKSIKELRALYVSDPANQKNTIFADSLAGLYTRAGQFDSAAWFAGEAATFFNTQEKFLKAGNSYYEAYTFAMDPEKRELLAKKTRDFFGKVLDRDPKNHEVKAKVAMTYLSSSSPMQGILMLREILAEDPKNEMALFNMGMLSIQSGQFERAIERLTELAEVNPNHVQGQLLLGVAFMNTGAKEKAKAQFEKVKKLDNDPSVQAAADSYLKDLK
ncbi:MAG: tetratricopeptide repeat protein [Bacteroidia bacterium]|nr:tetratricopeptide repeat protein [Bacteroidia bacterium]